MSTRITPYYHGRETKLLYVTTAFPIYQSSTPKQWMSQSLTQLYSVHSLMKPQRNAWHKNKKSYCKSIGNSATCPWNSYKKTCVDMYTPYGWGNAKFHCARPANLVNRRNDYCKKKPYIKLDPTDSNPVTKFRLINSSPALEDVKYLAMENQ